MPKLKINVKLLRQIQRAIKKEPRRFEMESWVNIFDSIAPCETTACIAGHAIIIDFMRKGGTWKRGGRKLYDRIDARRLTGLTQYRAGKLLGLEAVQSSRLFHLSEWPKRFHGRFGRALTRRAQGAVAIARIDHFIKTKGAE